MADQQSSRRDLLTVGAIGLGAVGNAAFFPSTAAAAPVVSTFDWRNQRSG